MNNPSGTSCMSIFIFPYEFSNSQIASLCFTRFFAGRFSFYIGKLQPRFCRSWFLQGFSLVRQQIFSKNTMFFSFGPLNGAEALDGIANERELGCPGTHERHFCLRLPHHSVVQQQKPMSFSTFEAFVYSPLGRAPKSTNCQ